jgi:hypothetical protein
MLSSLLAIGWKPEFHGVVIVIIAVVALPGTVYLLLGTNLGARLGVLVSLAGLFGWMATMGFIWWAYGIGLTGKTPVWKPADVIVMDGKISELGVGNQYTIDPDPVKQAAANAAVLEQDGWEKLADDSPSRALAISGADEILQKEAEILKASEYKAVAVYDKGGDRYPLIFNRDELDFLAFWHKPHYAIVEVGIVNPVYAEPGRAPRTPTVDESKPRVYVKMIRDLGDRRKNSAFIGIGSTVIFGVLCWMLHKRDRLVAANRAAKA